MIEYTAPILEIIEFDVEDVITTSDPRFSGDEGGSDLIPDP